MLLIPIPTHLPRLAPLLLISSLAAAQSGHERRVDSLLATFSTGNSPGAAVSVIRDGRVVLSKGYGLASLEHRIPITSATVFDVASVSKQFTGLAVAMLVEQGRIKLSDDIRTYIPELQDFGQTITIDHLVHHTSGLRDWPGTLSLAGWRMDDVVAFDQILAMASHQKTLNFKPGAEYTYSNTGYNLLAEMVKRVTGKSFRAWTDEQLFHPLGMSNSHFHDDHSEVVPNRAYGYTRSPDGTFQRVTNNLTALGSSSLFSTADDLAKWVINFDEPGVGGPASMARMRTRGVLNNGSQIAYAFGISHGRYRGLPSLSHSGGWAGFATFVLHFPEQRFGVVVLANSGIVNPSRAAYNIADIFLEKELAPRAAPVATGPGVSVAPAILDRYAGLYRLGPGWYVRIRREGNALKTQATNEPEFPVAARSDTAFWVDGYGAALVFRSEGPETHLEYRGRSYPRLAEPAPLSVRQLAEFAGTYESEELATAYQVDVQDGALVMRHRRHGTIALTHLWGQDFRAASWFMRSVEFRRDEEGRVVRFSVLVDERSRDIQFVRRP